LGKDQNWHMPCSIFACPFLICFWPSYALLQTSLGSFDRYIFEAFAKYFIYCCILACFRKSMTKTSSLKKNSKPNTSQLRLILQLQS
jgi:hypothetical protein